VALADAQVPRFDRGRGNAGGRSAFSSRRCADLRRARPDSRLVPMFSTTHWSAVLRAGRDESAEGRRALEDLCRAYWTPLHAFVRRQGYSVEDAEDLTQEFFAQLIARRDLAHLDPAKGRFRSFLLASLKHFLSNQRDREGALKRGGGTVAVPLDASATTADRIVPSDRLTPEALFERQWAVALLHRVLDDLRRECDTSDQGALFDALKDTLVGEPADATYAEIGRRLGLSESAVKVAAHRLRARYRARLCAEIAVTVEDSRDIDDELRALCAAFRPPR